MANGLIRMMTVTTRENIDDYDRFLTMNYKLIKELKNRYPKYKKLRYIAVPELQDRGALHLHYLISQYIPHKIIYKIWLEICGSGSVNLVFGGMKCINYAIKYLEKNLMINNFVTEKGFSRKAYIASKNLLRDVSKYRKEYCYTVIKSNNQEEVMKSYEWVNIFELEIEEAREQGRLIWDNISTYKIGDELKECRNILIGIK